MLADARSALAGSIRAAISEAFEVEHDPVLETPPRRALGDVASPAPLHLARVLKRSPRQIAAAVAEVLELPEAVRELRIEGAGYLNFFLHRGPAVARLLERPELVMVGAAAPVEGKVIVEHTNINPNKAAHIGHLRNAVLGDVLGRCYRALDAHLEVQNYIDDTGVQLADVVVGFTELRGESADAVAAHGEPFDYLCWDLYSEVGRWYEEDSSRLELRRATLHELERGAGPRADLGRLVARRIVGRHLRTMARIDIGYDLLTRESEILRLEFFQTAFDLLEAAGAVRLETEGKNEGCWVMPLSESEEFQGLEDPDKVIVRSDGTVTYVGKDIAYQMWKFGLLGRDFEYRRWPEPPSTSEDLWETAPAGDDDAAPSFGDGDFVVNVIDARQSYLQRIVKAGLEALGHREAAEASVHFAYEMVALSPATAKALGYTVEEDDGTGGSLEMSGRKGIGVKADDLIDQLEAKSREEIGRRDREIEASERDALARQIAVAALRYFMVKSTTTRVIAFDLEAALSFEGDSGPYLQYSLVRARNILRRLEEAGDATSVDAAALLEDDGEWDDDLWDLVLSAASLGDTVGRAAATLELSLLARHATDLAQQFHSVYHKHPILHEEDAALKRRRLAAVLVFRAALGRLLGILGIPTPDRM